MTSKTTQKWRRSLEERLKTARCVYLCVWVEGTLSHPFSRRTRSRGGGGIQRPEIVNVFWCFFWGGGVGWGRGVDVDGGQRECDIKNNAKVEKIPGGTIEDCKVRPAQTMCVFVCEEGVAV